LDRLSLSAGNVFAKEMMVAKGDRNEQRN